MYFSWPNAEDPWYKSMAVWLTYSFVFAHRVQGFLPQHWGSQTHILYTSLSKVLIVGMDFSTLDRFQVCKTNQLLNHHFFQYHFLQIPSHKIDTSNRMTVLLLKHYCSAELQTLNRLWGSFRFIFSIRGQQKTIYLYRIWTTPISSWNFRPLSQLQ